MIKVTKTSHDLATFATKKTMDKLTIFSVLGLAVYCKLLQPISNRCKSDVKLIV